MKLRVITTGLVAGILISIAALYPAISLIVPTTIPSQIRPIENELWHGIALMLSAAAAVFILVDFGIIAAKAAGATSWRIGAKAGGVSGLMMGVVSFVTIVSPILALNAYVEIADFQPHLTGELPSEAALDSYADLMLVAPIDWIFICLALNAALGAIFGAAFGWSQRNRTIEQVSLTTHINEGKHPRKWLGEDTQATAVAVIGGLLLGLVISFSNIEIFSKLTSIGYDIVAGIQQDEFVDLLFSPIASIMTWVFGGVIVYLINNPHNRWRERVGAVVIAFNMAIVPLFLLSFRYLTFIIGLLPFYVVHQWFDPMTGDVQADDMMLHELVSVLGQQTLQQEFFGTFIFLLPWAMLLISLIFMGIFGVLQGAFYATIIPLMRPRPVDHACSLFQRIKRDPTQVLPEFYQTFEKHGNSYEILSHLANRSYSKMPDVAKLAAYFHTLGTSDDPQEHSQVVRDIYQLTADHPDWRWSTDFGSVFWALHEVLEARTLEDILKIQPPAEHTTASLPTQIVQTVQLISTIINEIDKTQRVSDLQTKTIFLENALKAITKAKDTTAKDVKECPHGAVSPERTAIAITLNHWQETIVDVLQRMKGRALINSALENQSCTLTAQVPLVYKITNHGLNVAQGVQLRVRESADYHLVKNGHSDVFIDILPPGENYEAHIPIVPRAGVRRLRVEWEISYDDAIDNNRKVEFADVMEFTDPDKPFTRVFPIPYVTGTPLKSDDVFVGREEIFSFIQENLLGVHQNNAVILHGQRRTGKTSVLYRLGRVMSDTHISVLIDMQGKPARSTAEFLYSIADDITFELEEHGIEIDPPEWDDFAENPEFFFRSRFLRSLKKVLNGKNVLLLFDEFEELQQRVESGRLSPEIFPFLRNLVQHESHLDFVFSGTHKLEELGAEYWSILFNIAVYKPITFLSQAEMRRLIAEPVSEYNIEYDPIAVKRISKVTAGHPYFAQLVLHEMMVYHNETERNYFTVVDVDQVLERIVERGEAHFKYIWAESSKEEQTILRALTDMLMGKDAIHKKKLKGYLSERGQEWDDAYESGLNSLLSRDILDHLGQQSSIYRFKVDIIRLWIGRTRAVIV